jgi:lipopolysaccharide export system permease protein
VRIEAVARAAPSVTDNLTNSPSKFGRSTRTDHRLGTILGRYILREVATASVVVTAVLLVILLADQVAVVLERAALNQFPQGVVLELIGLGALQNLSILIPVGMLLGVVLAFGRLYHDSEMAAALACGAGPANIYLPVALLAVLVASALAWLTLSLAPDATARALSLRNAAVRAGQFAPIAPGKFRTFGGGNAVVYAESVARDGTMGNVFVEHNDGPRVEVAVAERARHAVTPDGMTHTITLYDGERFEGVPGSAQFRIVRFAEHVVPVQVPALTDVIRNLEVQPTSALLGSSDPEKRAELHWRMAMPSMCLVLTVLAVPLARLRPRQGRYARVWLAVVLYFVYSNLVSAGKVWLARGIVPPELGLWWTHVIAVVFVLGVMVGPRMLAVLRLRRRS